MNAVPPLSRAVQLGLLESALIAGSLARQVFLARAGALGVPSDAAGADADRFLAIAANQAQRRARLLPRIDCIAVGAGAAGSAVAGRLASNRAVNVLLVEAGDSTDLQTAVLATRAGATATPLAATHGIPTFDDQNGVMQEGPGGGAVTNVRIRDGRRLNVPADYLYPLMHQPNLTVLPGASAHQFLFDDRGSRTVRGVEFEWQGQVHRVDTDGEVILSAGALQTPKLLMLSGIGDRDDLRRFDIAPVVHLPGVGRNFQDHPIIGAGQWEPHEPIEARNNAAEANIFLKSRPDLPTPDLYIWNIEAPYLSEVTMAHAVPGAWSISPGLVRPESRGHVRLASANPHHALEIHAHMLGDHHPVGTAKMDRDEMSVVDAELRVYGVAKLRVADASVMPSITTGNTQAPSVVIGERMAELLAH